ncbi:MAG: EVE domain-containing protein [Patescibacteria group bacterium]
MANYYVDLFSPETATAFSKSDGSITGFRITQKGYAENNKIGPGDKFICYVTRIQRFVGILEVTSELFEDDTPIFTESEDPFTLRFKVKPLVWLPLEKAIPIHDDALWNSLSFTKGKEKTDNSWTYRVFSSPRLWPIDDCRLIEELLLKQKDAAIDYPFTEKERQKVKSQIIRVQNKEVPITVPDEQEEQILQPESLKEQRYSLSVQAMLAEIGAKLGYKVWLPANDRQGVLMSWKPEDGVLLYELPLVLDEITLKTIKNIDVLWIDRRSIVRAFEVEGTTSIYSGILRMADLLALQPMLNIKIHIVAPDERRDSVFMQINRPVFADIGGKQLADVCSYIPYSSISELSEEPKLKFMNHSIVDNYSQYLGD